jgi:beta-carotene ketolase (CrtO type)
MSDKSYDVVVMGGGHNALVLACYLTMNGMKVGVFEEKWELGGGACSEEYTSPGFISNPCANSVRFGHFPPYKDLKLKEYGLTFIYPKQSGSAIFDDDTCILTRPRYELDQETMEVNEVPGAAEKNYESVAAISQRDADTNEKIRELYENHWKPVMMEYVLSPPPPTGEKDPIEKLLEDPAMGLDPRYRFMTVGEIAFDLYESDHMRAYWMRSTASATGCLPTAVPSLAALIFSIQQLIGGSPPGITVGGTHQVAHALQRFLSTHGGEFWVHSPVEKVLIENGKAKGIRLKDGTEIEATKMVISGFDAFQTLEAIGEEHVGPEVIRKAKNLDLSMGPLWWGSIALHEGPKYRIEAQEPEAACFRNYLLPVDAQYVRYRYPAEVFTRGYSDRIIHPYHLSHFDPNRAPAGKYEIMFEEYAPPAFYWPLREWLKKKDEFFEAMLKRWQFFAPNMTWDNIISVHFNSPIEIQMRNRAMREGQQFQISNIASQGGQFRPLPELSRYKMPVKDLYLCSSSAHPMGAMHGWVGYSCYKIIAEDFGLRKIWEENGRPY